MSVLILRIITVYEDELTSMNSALIPKPAPYLRFKNYKTFITKTRLYNFDPLKPNFYIVKLGFTGVYIIFLIFAQKHRLWVLVRTASSIYVLSNNVKNIKVYLSENFQFLEVKFSIYLNRRVFVMSLDWYYFY